jgi:curved DNA-binding protein
MTDHYATLGVSKTATADEIKRAFRKLASQHHPDKGGDTATFQKIQGAYDTLGDAAKRAAYDNPPAQHNFSNFGGAQFNDIFGQMFGGGFPGFNQTRRNHVRVTLWITLHDVATGGARTVSLGTAQGASAVEINIPVGIEDNDNVQYAGIGPSGTDLVVTFKIRPDSQWQRQGQNLIQEQRVNVWDLITGGSVQITDILNNQLQITIPPGTQPGTMLRVRGRGLPNSQGQTGDMFVKVHAVLPAKIAPEILEAIQKYR